MGGLDVLKVLYVPTLQKNLSSTGYLGDVGHIIVFPDYECWIMSNFNEREVLATRKRDDQNGLDKLMTSNSSINVLQTTLHARYGHLNYKSLSHLSQKERVHGLPRLEISKKIGEHCLAGSQDRKTLSKKHH